VDARLRRATSLGSERSFGAWRLSPASHLGWRFLFHHFVHYPLSLQLCLRSGQSCSYPSMFITASLPAANANRCKLLHITCFMRYALQCASRWKPSKNEIKRTSHLRVEAKATSRVVRRRPQPESNLANRTMVAVEGREKSSEIYDDFPCGSQAKLAIIASTLRHPWGWNRLSSPNTLTVRFHAAHRPSGSSRKRQF
jgi:hypothetical protein